MAYATTINQDALALQKRMVAACAVLKGYPEYNPDQDRDESGKWTGGGSQGGTRKPRAARGGTKAPKPRKPLSTNPKAVRARERYRERVTRQMSEATRAAQNAARATATRGNRTKDADYAVARRALDALEEFKSMPDGVWRDATIADEAFKALTNFWTIMGATLLSGPTAGVSALMWGGSLTLVGTYLLMRYVWRKISTGGRYRGVTWPHGDSVVPKEYRERM